MMTTMTMMTMMMRMKAMRMMMRTTIVLFASRGPVLLRWKMSQQPMITSNEARRHPKDGDQASAHC